MIKIVSEAPIKEGFYTFLANRVELNKIEYNNMVDMMQFNIGFGSLVKLVQTNIFGG